MRANRRRREEGSEAGGDTDGRPALCAALLGTLLLGSELGVESHWELLLLLAIVAGLAIVLERAAVQRVVRRTVDRPGGEVK